MTGGSMTNFRYEIRNGSYHKVCIHCGESISTNESGKKQLDFTFKHVMKHQKGPVFTEVKAK